MEQAPNMNEPNSAIRPPYIPFATLKNFIERLKGTGLPHRIDKSVMSGMSGATQSQLTLAMKYLRLIDDDGTPLDALEELTDAFNTPQWNAAIGRVLIPAYKPILNGLDVSKATMGQFEELFRERGNTEGTVTDKGIRFYLKVLDEAGIKYSPHLTKKRGPRGPNKKRRENSDSKPASDTGSLTEAAPPTGMMSIPLHLPGRENGGHIVVPRDISASEVKLIDVAMAYLRMYAAEKNGKGDN